MAGVQTLSTLFPPKAAAGANADITSLLALTTPLSPAQGGTGTTTAAAELARIGGITLAKAVAAAYGDPCNSF